MKGRLCGRFQGQVFYQAQGTPSWTCLYDISEIPKCRMSPLKHELFLTIPHEIYIQELPHIFFLHFHKWWEKVYICPIYISGISMHYAVSGTLSCVQRQIYLHASIIHIIMPYKFCFTACLLKSMLQAGWLMYYIIYISTPSKGLALLL